VNSETVNKLKEEEGIFNELKDIHLEIKDLEGELEWVNVRESDDAKYITYLMKRIDSLYKKSEELDEAN
tara:strand:+ start:108 stop:314 length:207 start_codon:yes stop_codon:yes gene_type:complete